MPGQHQGEIEAARHAAGVIATEGGARGDLSLARAAFDTMEAIL